MGYSQFVEEIAADITSNLCTSEERQFHVSIHILKLPCILTLLWLRLLTYQKFSLCKLLLMETGSRVYSLGF